MLVEVKVPWSGQAGREVDCVLDRDGSAVLAFDHAAAIGMAVKRMRGKVACSTVGYEPLPGSSTMRALQRVHDGDLRPANGRLAAARSQGSAEQRCLIGGLEGDDDQHRERNAPGDGEYTVVLATPAVVGNT